MLAKNKKAFDEKYNRFKPLLEWRESKAEEARKAGEKMFLGKPDSWYESIHFGCINGHTSTSILKSEALGADLCLSCHEITCIIPQMTEEEFGKVVKALPPPQS